MIQHILHKPLAFIVRDFRIATSYRLSFIIQFAGIFFNSALFFMVAKLVNPQNFDMLHQYGESYFPFLLTGIALADYFTFATSSFATDIRQAQVMGTLETLLITPTAYLTIIFSAFLYQLIFTSLRVLLYFLLAIVVFGVELHVNHPFALLTSFLLTLLPFIGIGLLSAAFIIVLKQGNPINYIVTISSSLLGGVLYPVAILPDWIEPVAVLLPITHGLEAMRQILLIGAGIQEVWSQLIILFFFSIFFITSGLFAVLYAISLAKKEGSLLHY